MRVCVRRFLTFACLLAAWVVARPAAASAPMCDERGASMLAPTPVLDAPNASIDVGEQTDGCDADAWQEKAYHRGEGPHRTPSPKHVDAVLAPQACRVSPRAPDASMMPDVRTVDRSGVRFALERPPRQ